MTFALLNKHPDIALMYECDVQQFWPIVRDHWVKKDWLNRLNIWNGAFNRHHLDGTFTGNNRRAVAMSLYKNYAARKGKRLAGEKSPAYCECLEQVFGNFPNARFVIICRDPLDVLRSVARASKSSRFFAQMGMFHRILYSYVRLQADIPKIEARGARVFHLIYEQFVQNPRAKMTALCEFLEVPFSEALLDMEGADLSAVHEGKHHERLGKKISARNSEPELLPEKILDKVSRYRAFWRNRYPHSQLTLHYPIGNHRAGSVSLLERFVDRLVIAAINLRERVVRFLYGFLPLQIITAYRSLMVNHFHHQNQRPFQRTPVKLPVKRFSIVTPSYKQLKWLKLCAQSVADQTGVQVEHIIQDAQTGKELNDWVAANTRAKLFIESDDGMYDAINRGFRRATGDILAWLNCDEQYLPGALEKVAAFFTTHPGIDVVFGDALLIGENGELLSYRRAILPALLHIRLSHLNTLSCATFIRRSVLERGFHLASEWKAIADAVWVSDMLKARIPMAVLHEPLAVFTVTESNLGQTSLAQTETNRWQQSSPVPGALWLRIPLIILHRLRKLVCGAYFIRRVEVELYTQSSPTRRILLKANRLSFTWESASEVCQRKGIAREVFAELIKPFTQTFKGNAFDLENIAPVETVSASKAHETPIAFPVLLSLFTAAVILFIDWHVERVVLTPALAALFLLVFSFFIRPKQMIVMAMVLLFAVFISLCFLPPHPPAYDSVFWLQLFIRCGGFTATCLMALFVSIHRLRSVRLLSEIVVILNKMPLPVLVSDAAGYIIYVNDEATGFMGCTKESLLGKRYVKLFMGNKDEGQGMRFYIQFFEKTGLNAERVLLTAGKNHLQIEARLICLGEGDRRQLITVLGSQTK